MEGDGWLNDKKFLGWGRDCELEPRLALTLFNDVDVEGNEYGGTWLLLVLSKILAQHKKGQPIALNTQLTHGVSFDSLCQILMSIVN